MKSLCLIDNSNYAFVIARHVSNSRGRLIAGIMSLPWHLSISFIVTLTPSVSRVSRATDYLLRRSGLFSKVCSQMFSSHIDKPFIFNCSQSTHP